MSYAYVDSVLGHAEGDATGLHRFLQHLHWGLFDDPDVTDDSPERYLAAAEAMTDRVLSAARIDDGGTHAVLDVGCGFGGTLDRLRRRHRSGRLVGVNVDHRQLEWARRLVGGDVGFVTGDGCRLPVASASVDRVLAVECVFHFPSRRTFFAEAARVLRPGGMLALSDFLVAPGELSTVARTLASSVDGSGWYGHLIRPLTVAGYRRLAHRSGFELVLDDDVTARTLPTYAALRRLARDAQSSDGLVEIDALDTLARGGQLGYHVLGFQSGSRATP